MANFLQKCLLFVVSLQITMEPIMFLLAASNSFRQIVTPALSESKMERVYSSEAPANMTKDQTKKFYNKKMVEWDNNYEYVNLPIACIVGIMYGGYSDYHGRKLPLLVGISSLIVENAVRMLIYDPHTDWSLHWLFPLGAVVGLLGDQLLTISCINAYVTDTFEDKKKLSIRMIIVSICFSLGSFVSSRIVKAVLPDISHIGILGIAEGMYSLTFLYGLLVVTNKIPKRKSRLSEEDELVTNDIYGQSTWSIIKLSFYSIYDSAKIFLLPRDGHRRLFLYLCFLANFLDQFVFGEEKSLIGTYTRLPPFNWDSSEYAEYKSWRPIVQIVGMFVGMLFFKNLLKLRDTFVICLAIASMGGCVLMIGLAKASWVIFASLAPGSLHGLLNPLTYSFMSSVVEQDEVGKAFAVSSIAQKAAGFAQTAVLQNIYIATVDWYQGFVWILMSGISFVAVLIYFVVHVIAKKENVGI